MNFESLIEYQKADIEFRKLRKQIASDENKKLMISSKEQFEDAKKKCADSDALAQNIMKAYNDALAYLEKTEKEVADLIAKVSEGKLSEEEEAKAVETLSALRGEYAEWEKKALSLKSNAEKAISEYATAQKKGVEARNAYQTAKKAYEALVAENEEKLKELEEKCLALRAQVDEGLLNLYDTVVKESKIIGSVVIPLMGDEKNATCGACGMGLSTADKDALLSNGYIRCETCHRIIYKQ